MTFHYGRVGGWQPSTLPQSSSQELYESEFCEDRTHESRQIAPLRQTPKTRTQQHDHFGSRAHISTSGSQGLFASTRPAFCHATTCKLRRSVQTFGPQDHVRAFTIAFSSCRACSWRFWLSESNSRFPVLCLAVEVIRQTSRQFHVLLHAKQSGKKKTFVTILESRLCCTTTNSTRASQDTTCTDFQ